MAHECNPVMSGVGGMMKHCEGFANSCISYWNLLFEVTAMLAVADGATATVYTVGVSVQNNLDSMFYCTTIFDSSSELSIDEGREKVC